MAWAQHYYTYYRMTRDLVAPWIAIGPVTVRDGDKWRLTGFMVQIGGHNLAVHKNLARLAEESN